MSLANQRIPTSLFLLLACLKARPREMGRWMLGTPISPPPAREANVQLSQLSRGATPDLGTRYRKNWVEG